MKTEKTGADVFPDSSFLSVFSQSQEDGDSFIISQQNVSFKFEFKSFFNALKFFLVVVGLPSHLNMRPRFLCIFFI